MEHTEVGELPEDTAVFFSPVMWGWLRPFISEAAQRPRDCSLDLAPGGSW